MNREGTCPCLAIIQGETVLQLCVKCKYYILPRGAQDTVKSECLELKQILQVRRDKKQLFQTIKFHLNSNTNLETGDLNAIKSLPLMLRSQL